MAAYELVDHEGGNVLGAFSSRDAALESIRRTIASPAHGRIADLALYDARGLVAKGAKLAALAAESASSRKSA